jgi:hypothetical protein
MALSRAPSSVAASVARVVPPGDDPHAIVPAARVRNSPPSDRRMPATVPQPFALAVDQPFALANDQPFALAVDQPFALANDQPFALAVDQPFALANDQPFALANDQPFALAVDQPFALANDAMKSASALAPATGMAL